MIRVLLVDDQGLVRAGFKALLDARDDIEVIGEAADGAGAVDLAGKLRPDVILMDIRMPGLDGLEATRQIAADPRLADVRIVILTTFGLDEYLFDALRFGASGFLLKDTEPADLATAVRLVARGDSLISPSMTRRLVAEFASRAKAPPPNAGLDAITQREREVMALVADGLTNDEIARKLCMTKPGWYARTGLPDAAPATVTLISWRLRSSGSGITGPGRRGRCGMRSRSGSRTWC